MNTGIHNCGWNSHTYLPHSYLECQYQLLCQQGIQLFLDGLFQLPHAGESSDKEKKETIKYMQEIN